jgi:hypothetical protein
LERGEDDRQAAAVHPASSRHHPSPPPPITNMRGSLVRGAVNAQRRATSQQQQQSRTLPAPTPLASRVGGGQVGLTVSARARHAFDLYSQCVVAGQWSKLVIEQRCDGEHISLHSRPMAAAASTAASPAGRRRKKRKPNQKRLERQQRRRKLRSERQQQEPARHDPSDRQQAATSRSPASHTTTPAADVSVSLQQQQQSMCTPRAGFSYAAVAASPPRPTAANGPTARSSLVASPRLTRAAKKRRGYSSPGDETAFAQVDGADVSPPSTPPEPLSPEDVPRPAAAALAEQPTATAEERPRLQEDPPETEAVQPAIINSLGSAFPEPVKLPPPPPPWSRCLPKDRRSVICRSCLRNAHRYDAFLGMSQCTMCEIKESKSK